MLESLQYVFMISWRKAKFLGLTLQVLWVYFKLLNCIENPVSQCHPCSLMLPCVPSSTFGYTRPSASKISSSSFLHFEILSILQRTVQKPPALAFYGCLTNCHKHSGCCGLNVCLLQTSWWSLMANVVVLEGRASRGIGPQGLPPHRWV